MVFQSYTIKTMLCRLTLFTLAVFVWLFDSCNSLSCCAMFFYCEKLNMENENTCKSFSACINQFDWLCHQHKRILLCMHEKHSEVCVCVCTCLISGEKMRLAFEMLKYICEIWFKWVQNLYFGCDFYGRCFIWGFYGWKKVIWQYFFKNVMC